MVNGLQCKRRVVVKSAVSGGVCATAKGGAVLVEALSNRLGLAGACRRFLPGRRDGSQGFEVAAVVSSLVHGLLCGGRGLSATEPMRGDVGLLRMLGLELRVSISARASLIKF